MFLLLALVVGGGCGSSGSVERAGASAEGADAMFRRGRPMWRGGDAAYSVALGEGRVLWMFGDSFVSAKPPHSRATGTMVRNSIAIQEGRDPAEAGIEFHWSGGGTPSAFFGAEEGWLWPGGGVVVDGALTVFLWEMVETDGGMWGFETAGWRAVRVAHPERPPGEWEARTVGRGSLVHEIIPGSFGVVRRGEWVYAFGADDTARHRVYVARWEVADFGRGELGAAEWWYGGGRGWAALEADEAPEALFGPAQTEGSIHWDADREQWVAVHSVGFGATEIGVRTAPRPTGPWSEVETVYRPPESDRDGVLVYAGKAHPWAAGEGLLVTYATNHTDFGTMVGDESLYYPRFVWLTAK